MLRPRQNDENGENGGCRAGKGMVYQRHGSYPPENYESESEQDFWGGKLFQFEHESEKYFSEVPFLVDVSDIFYFFCLGAGKGRRRSRRWPGGGRF